MAVAASSVAKDTVVAAVVEAVTVYTEAYTPVVPGSKDSSIPTAIVLPMAVGPLPAMWILLTAAGPHLAT